MTAHTNPLTQPDQIRDRDGERQDGRPTEHIDADQPGKLDKDAPTVAPEEKGHTPTTEHGPGADL